MNRREVTEDVELDRLDDGEENDDSSCSDERENLRVEDPSQDKEGSAQNGEEASKVPSYCIRSGIQC